MLSYILYFLISIILGIILLFLSVFNTKIRNNYYTSYQQIYFLYKVFKIFRTKKKIILFHAASAGEYEQIKPILKGVDRTEYFIVQSFTSPSIYKIKHEKNLYDVKCYHPFDIFWLSYLFFKIIKPHKYIVTRHDIWPGHILMANYFQIPIYFINANIHKNSIWYKPSIRFFVRYFFNKINYFIVPSQYIANNLKNIVSLNNQSNIHVIQDTRFNQIVNIKDNNQFYDYIKDPDHVITFGSIDLLDEKFIFQLLPKIIIQKNIILVPHDVDSKTIQRLEKHLSKMSLQYNKFSVSGLDFSNKILLVDVLGVLAQLYTLGSYAYVGGGFRRGVHSVLEPAAYGCSIACGPNIEMLDEAKQLRNVGILHLIDNINDLDLFINQKTKKHTFMDNISLVPNEMINFLLNND